MRWATAAAVMIPAALAFAVWETTRSTEPTPAPRPTGRTKVPTLREYVERMSPMARTIETETGVPMALALAQSALESRRGDSWLSQRYHNFFGVKAGKRWQGAIARLPSREVKPDGSEPVQPQPFRAYPDALTGWRDWAAVVKRIAGITSSSAQAWAGPIARGGYATDPNYKSVLEQQIAQVERILAEDGPAAVSGPVMAEIRKYF